MPAIVLVAYIGLCFLSGYVGRYSRLGFWGCALLSALLTPLVVLPVLFFLGGSGRRWQRRQIN
jgi:hypothetical protein